MLHRIQYENDETAFEEFYREHVFRLFQFAFAFVRNKELSEEIVNDVFLKFWQHRSRIDQIDNISVYLYVAVKNTAANYLRRKGLDEPELTAHHFYLSPDPEQLLVTEELRRTIQYSIDRLPPRCKLIFKLVKEDGLSCAEVASILDISYKTVTTQLTIALKKLSEHLQPSLGERRIKA
ncbi:RNA polymerase sigma-70 factor [Dinghuibacter silviterrae]|uniref:RNA polymerase sigma-70 factor n=1 Tax=Dinghuibacter silviterrae TaxID=1539049 RepID=UPI0013C33845|nr:RNA polymerase sigma-70 factor [Dinghuibacter silviterrae]